MVSNIAAAVTILGLLVIPWLITDPVWRFTTLFFIGLYVVNLLYEKTEKSLLPENKAIVITGCGSGIGYGMAKHLDKRGFYVYAGCRDATQEGAKTLQSNCSKRLKVIQLDVTKDEEVDKVARIVKDDGHGLWGLINNAGIHLLAEVELAPLHAFQKHFDVNCLGQIRMVKAFLPLLKRSKGRIVNIGTVNTRVYGSMFAAYNISKVGVEAFSDVLRLEMMKWNVNVSFVYLGAFDTKMAKFPGQVQYFEEIQQNLSDSQKQYYNEVYFKTVMDRVRKITEDSSGKIVSSDFTPIYTAVAHALLSQRPKSRYYAGLGAQSLVALGTHCPNWFLDWLFTASPIMYREKGLLPPKNMQFD